MGPTQQWLQPKKAVMSHEDSGAEGLQKPSGDRASTREDGRGNWPKAIFNGATQTRPGLKEEEEEILRKIKICSKG